MAVRQELYHTFDGGYWVRAEISEIRENANGHCYLELVEKDSSDKLIVAKTKASIWADTYRMLKPYFKEETGQYLNVGLKILVEVSVNFHEVYGFSCVIRDIDPTFTLGDLAKKRQETIKKLKEDGIWDLNKSLEFPMPANRIAIISSATAAGYGDFINQLQSNKKRYTFYHKLFPAIMQGDEAESSIIGALDRIYNHIDLFDAVVIIRGGGATTDMLAFDEYELAAHCAQYPLPIITGIGHNRDESVVDMVAYMRCMTPTAAAALLIDKMDESATELTNLQNGITIRASGMVQTKERELRNIALSLSQNLNLSLQKENYHLSRIVEMIGQKTDVVLWKKKSEMEEKQQQLKETIQKILNKEEHRIKLINKTFSLVNPQNILKKGYTLTIKNGSVVRSVKQLQSGDVIATLLADGKKQSTIN